MGEPKTKSSGSLFFHDELQANIQMHTRSWPLSLLEPLKLSLELWSVGFIQCSCFMDRTRWRNVRWSCFPLRIPAPLLPDTQLTTSLVSSNPFPQAMNS